jgi:hypothetical protein
VSYNIRVLVEGFMSDVVQIDPLLLDCILSASREEIEVDQGN